jgi:hypothetical protein
MAFFIALYIVGMILNDILNIIYLKRPYFIFVLQGLPTPDSQTGSFSKDTFPVKTNI